MTELGRKVTVIEGKQLAVNRPGYWLGRALKFVVAALVVTCWMTASSELIASACAQQSSALPRPPAKVAGVAHVVDGDTIEVGPWRVRLFGIDAPELRQVCSRGRDRVDCGQIAHAALERLAEGRTLECVRRDVDRYRRIVAVCSTSDGRDVGRMMVEIGWAVAFRRYSPDYISAEDVARVAKRGLWSGEFELPEDWRREHRR